MTTVTFEYSNKQIQLSKAKRQIKVCGLDVYIDDYSLLGDFIGNQSDRLYIATDWPLHTPNEITIGASGNYLAVGIHCLSRVNVGGALIYKTSLMSGYMLYRKIIPHSTVTEYGSAITVDTTGEYVAVHGMEGEVPYVYIYNWDDSRDTYTRVVTVNLQRHDFVNEVLFTFIYMPWSFNNPIKLELMVYHPSDNRAIEISLDSGVVTYIT